MEPATKKEKKKKTDDPGSATGEGGEGKTS